LLNLCYPSHVRLAVRAAVELIAKRPASFTGANRDGKWRRSEVSPPWGVLALSSKHLAIQIALLIVLMRN
jgi:hypothetical protein